MPTSLELKLLLDEGVPNSVGHVFQSCGYDVSYGNRDLVRGIPDPMVCRIALLNGRVLVACDGDMRTIAKQHGVSRGEFANLNLIKLSCYKPRSADRVKSAISLIQHEWEFGANNDGRRIFIEVSDGVIRTVR